MYVVIAGGGIAGRRVAKFLMERKHDVVVIDIDKSVCEDLYVEYGIVCVHGSASDIGTLKEAGIEKAHVAIAAMYRDIDNLSFALLASSFNVPRIIVKMRDPEYEEAYKKAGATVIASMTDLFLTRVIMEIESPLIKRVTVLPGSQGELVMAKVYEGCMLEGMRIGELEDMKEFPKDVIVVGVFSEKKRKLMTSRRDHVLEAGDDVFFIATPENFGKLNQIFAVCRINKKGGGR